MARLAIRRVEKNHDLQKSRKNRSPGAGAVLTPGKTAGF